MTKLQLRIRQLLDQVEQITKEQNYQRVINALYLLLFCYDYRLSYLCSFERYEWFSIIKIIDRNQDSMSDFKN